MDTHDIDARLAEARAAARDLPGWREREGQGRMMDAVASAFARGRLGSEGERPPDATAAVAVVEGGTGVGKTLGYLVPGVTLARARGTRLVVSTATVALQEQLIDRDLPALAKVLPGGLSFALLKGRGRFVCSIKLGDALTRGYQHSMLFDDVPLLPSAAIAAAAGQGAAGGTPAGGGMPASEGAPATGYASATGEASASDGASPGAPAAHDRFARDDAPDAQAERQSLQRLADRLADGWSGDRDSLAEAVPDRTWSMVAADRHSCTGRHCPQFGSCSYYSMRRAIKGVDVLVVNHDLVLSSLANGAATVPAPEDALWVFDEAHHLPGIALAQFASRLELSGLPRTLRAAGGALERATMFVERRGTAAALAPAFDVAREAAAALERMLAQLLPPEADAQGLRTVRFAHGAVPPPVADEAARLHGAVDTLARAFADEIGELKRAIEGSREPDTVARLATELAVQHARLDTALRLLEDFAAAGEPPRAKWVEAGDRGLTLHASPVTAAGVLRSTLWQRASACVLTSATLRTLGNFDYFLREAGLARLPGVEAVAVPSPFDYPSQGSLVVYETERDPGEARLHTEELARQALPAQLAKIGRGALLLCTSREQLGSILRALPARLRNDCLVQGEAPRAELLARHRQRVASGKRSVLVGLQSFGEGLDLPGELCEAVLIAKIPFAPPDSPIEQARSEWLQSQGRNPFVELSVPAAGLKLTQWAGRGIRTETDTARIVIFDRRLVTRPYGRGLLAGLPPFALRRADATGERELVIGPAASR